MKKMCPRCGLIYPVKDDPVYCSQKCKNLFQVSALAVLKGRTGYVTGNTKQHGEDAGAARNREDKPFRPVAEKMANFENDANTEVMVPKPKQK